MTINMMRKAANRYEQVLGAKPHTHGAAGWQMNVSAFVEHDTAGYRFASDGRAMLDARGAMAQPSQGPHRVRNGNTILQCVQLPTTLPTLDELLGCEIDGKLITTGNVAAHILSLTADNPRDHVYTLHAELEGQKLAPVFEQLLAGWKAQGYQFAAMGDYYEKIKESDLPVCPITWDELPGRSGRLIVQGKAA